MSSVRWLQTACSCWPIWFRSSRVKGLEDVFTTSEKLQVQAGAYPEASTCNKTHFNRAVQGLLATGREAPALSAETVERMKRLVGRSPT